jgi:tetratricopeptide (TPR) repeat protein
MRPTSQDFEMDQVTVLLSEATRLLQAGRPEQAVVPLREATRWLPRNAALFHDLGLAYLECGRFGEAVAALETSIAIDPTFQDSHLRLGIAHESAGAADAALVSYQRAAELQPLPEALFRLANHLDNLGHSNRAIEVFRAAAAVASRTTLGRLAMARALVAEDRDAEALKALRRALAEDPDSAAVLDLLANTLADAGRFEGARRCFLRAIDAAPALAGSYYYVVRCRRISRGPEDAALIARMRASLESPTLESSQRIRVELALGKAADDLGDYEQAMRHFDSAEALRNSLIRFDLGKFEARVDRQIGHFSADVIANAGGCDESTPILIFGLPRSGTTLIEQILSAHPQVGAAGELSFWNERGSAWERDPTVAASGADYVGLLRIVGKGARRVTDKMPLNFQWAGLVHAALPRATLIHCRRNLVDTALSIHQTHFNPRMWFPTGGAALVGYIRAYERLCAHWRAVLPAQRFIEVDYEELVARPEPAIRHILEKCELSWSSQCLFPERNARAVKTPSKWQVRQPIYANSVGRWRRYEQWLGPLADLQVLS